MVFFFLWKIDGQQRKGGNMMNLTSLLIFLGIFFFTVIKSDHQHYYDQSAEILLNFFSSFSKRKAVFSNRSIRWKCDCVYKALVKFSIWIQ
jgi:hypothetical protein